MANLTIEDLFTPAPSGIDPTNSASTPADDTWLGTELSVAATVQLATTSWLPGDPSRTLLAIMAVGQAMRDGNVSLMAQGGFLDWAATGTVTYETAPGVTITVPVTPDPSIPAQNPTGAPGWLDVLAYEVYFVQRTKASNAAGPLYIVNTSASTYTYSPGTFHVANEATAAPSPPTYSNLVALSVTPSPSTSITGGSIEGTLVTLTVSSTTGTTVGGVLYVTGTGNATIDNTWQVITSVGAGSVQFNSPTASGTFTTGTVYVPASFSFQADVAGPSSSAVQGAIVTLVTTQLGLDCYNAAPFVGSNWESNTALVQRCRARLASLSPSGPSGAYVYFALSAAQILAGGVLDGYPISVATTSGGTINVSLETGAITGALVQLDPTTGIITVSIANAAGTTQGTANNPIVSATTASPIVIGTSVAHQLGTGGGFVYLQGVQGLQGANGYFHATFVDATHFSLDGSTGTGAYTTGGTAEVGDLGMVDLIIQDNALPDNEAELTQWALTTNVTVSATVYVPASQVTNYQNAVGTALTLYFASLPIGGIVNAEANNIIPIDAIVGLLYAAGISGAGGSSYVKSLTSVTLNGTGADLSIGVTTKALLSGGATGISVVGV